MTFKNPRALLAGDLDQDNDTDLIVTQAQGPALLLRNDGGNTNHAIRVALTGLADNRSGVGTKVEVQAGATWQKFETVSASGFLGQSSPEILAGIGQATEADVVRLLWPTGVVQDEVQLAAGKRHAITEVDRRGSSCPILFTWNGSTFEFVSDAIGPAVIGHWIAPGQVLDAGHGRVRQGGRQQAARARRPAVAALHRADGGDQLPRRGAALRGRPSARHRDLPERVLRGGAALPRRPDHRDAPRASAAGRVG